MASTPRPRILCVDDELGILQLQSRILGQEFEVATAMDGEAGLEVLRRDGPFTAIVSDLRMPGMDGISFLSHARREAPDTMRLLLTAYADAEAAVGAINEGAVFRFLTKPFSPLELLQTLRGAAERHQELIAERGVVDQVQHGWVQALDQVLAMTSPTASRRARRAREYAGELARSLKYHNPDEIEVAALLSQVDLLALPPETFDKVHNADGLTRAEQEWLNELPRMVQRVFNEIPRFETVIRILSYQHKHFSGQGPPRDGVRGRMIPWGARLLKVVLDYLALDARGMEASQALSVMQGRGGLYDPEILSAFAHLRGIQPARRPVVEITRREVQTGMILAEDLKTRSGLLLVPRGQEISEKLAERIRSLPPTMEVNEPLRIIFKQPSDDPLEFDVEVASSAERGNQVSGLRSLLRTG